MLEPVDLRLLGEHVLDALLLLGVVDVDLGPVVEVEVVALLVEDYFFLKSFFFIFFRELLFPSSSRGAPRHRFAPFLYRSHRLDLLFSIQIIRDMRSARASESKTPTPTPHLDHHRRDRLPAEDPSSADRELALVVLQDAHGPEGTLARVVDALEEAADLIHDDEVDGVLVDVPGFFFRVFRGGGFVSFLFFKVVSEALPGRQKKRNRA